MDKIKISVRLTEQEHKRLKTNAAACALKMEPYIRKLIMGKEVRPRPPDEYIKLLREINAIGNNINQIAHIANAEQRISENKINEVLHLQNEIMRMVRSVRYWLSQKYGQSNQGSIQALNISPIPTRLQFSRI